MHGLIDVFDMILLLFIDAYCYLDGLISLDWLSLVSSNFYGLHVWFCLQRTLDLNNTKHFEGEGAT